VVSATDLEPDLEWLRGELSEIRRELLPPGESRALYLALDQGGTSSRAVLFDTSGREVASALVPVSTLHPAPGRVEHDPEELVRTLLTAARDACESPLAVDRPIAAAGLATQRSTIVCWDRETGAALGPAISWQDRRHAQWLEAHLGDRAAWVRELTGLPLSPHYGASKLRWSLDESAPVRLALRDARLAAGPLASFLLHRLCDERPNVVDPANASRTLLHDPATLDWSPLLLEAFGIPEGVLPQCVGTQYAFGTFSLGRRRVPLRACSGDQSACLYAFGQPDATTAFVNVGTGAFVQRVLRGPHARPPQGLLQSVVHAEPGRVSAATCSHEGTVNGAGSALEWLARQTGLDSARAMRTLAMDATTATMPLLFMNGVGGLGAPFWRADFPIEFVTVPGREDATDVEQYQLAAVVESIVFLLAVNVELMQRCAPLRKLVVTGGLAASDYLCQALADVTGMRVERPALQEATARGIAYLAAAQPQEWQPIPTERLFSPSGAAHFVDRMRLWREAVAVRLERCSKASVRR
jgi:glycerol kinase